MIIRKDTVASEDLTVFLNNSLTKIIRNIEARNGRLKSFNLNFNFERSTYILTEKDMKSFRSRDIDNYPH